MPRRSLITACIMLSMVISMILPVGIAVAQEESSEDVPSVAVGDQESDGNQVTVDEVTALQDGWMVIHADADGKPGIILGQTPVPPGMTENVIVFMSEPIAGETTLWAMLHDDAGELATFEFPDGPDVPVKVDDAIVMQAFTATGPAMEDAAEAETEAAEAEEEAAPEEAMTEEEAVTEEEAPAMEEEAAPEEEAMAEEETVAEEEAVPEEESTAEEAPAMEEEAAPEEAMAEDESVTEEAASEEEAMPEEAPPEEMTAPEQLPDSGSSPFGAGTSVLIVVLVLLAFAGGAVISRRRLA